MEDVIFLPLFLTLGSMLVKKHLKRVKVIKSPNNCLFDNSKHSQNNYWQECWFLMITSDKMEITKKEKVFKEEDHSLVRILSLYYDTGTKNDTVLEKFY